MNFADASIRYKLKTLEFTLNYNNIFNTKRYISAAYNGIGSYYASYELRPTQVLAKIRFKIN
jgi:outer membrane receptor protein involved in Fe transport